MEEEVPKVNVRQLISVYESGATQRQRARSLGNVLGNDVIVRSHNYQTLSDIQEALEVVEENLNDYQVYNKAKHVKFQETLFTLLTSVINIEADPEDDPARKKHLITQTQKLVSCLNRKLPSSGTSNNSSGYTETDQGSIRVSQGKAEENRFVSSESIERTKEVFEGEYTVSVHKLKQNFQSSSTTVETKSQHVEVDSKTNGLLAKKVPKSTDNETFVSSDSAPIPPEPIKPEEPTKPEEPVSVRKLRDIFEKKEKENKTGLELIIRPKTYQYEVSIPYTAESLGRYRLFRANSGNYINEVGVLNRVNISRAKSTQEFESYSYDSYSEKQEEDTQSIEDTLTDSEASSVISEADSLESVKEARNDSPGSWQGDALITVRNAVKVFETFKEVNIQGAKSMEISEQIITNSDTLENNLENEDDETITKENGLDNGNKTDVEITEITPGHVTLIKSQLSVESENGLESFADKNDLMY